MVGMEAAAVSAAVSGMLKVVVNKLASLVLKQYSSIVGAKKDLQELQDLAVEINFWLETAKYNAMRDAPSFNWLKRLKDVAYDVDDVVDEFQLRAEKHDANGGIVSKFLNPKSTILFQCKAASKINQIKKRFAEIVKQRTDINAIANSLPVHHHVSHINERTVEIPSLPTVDAASVLGRDQEKHEIISRLTQTNDKEIIKIISVVGLGGSGKTTLAKLVFNDGSIVHKYFEVRLWVHVSQEFYVEKVVEKLFEAIAGEKSDRYTLQQMSKDILDKLTGKRYLIVFDDVWTEDRYIWENFLVHVKGGAPGSKILITTRSKKVAEAVDSVDIFNLSFLSEADSWQVFEQSFGMTVEDLDSEFIEIGKDIVKKCGGVPLAIKVLAGILRDKKRIEEWQAMKKNNLLDVEDKENRVYACLRLSYFYLPSHLKQCFTICSLFPKGYKIDKEQLIDLWIAHDMIALENGVDYLEISGGKCFESLVHMSFIQDVNKNCHGRVECKMHDLVHDLARSIMGDNLSFVLPEEITNSAKSYRYFSLVDKPKNLPSATVFQKARAMYDNTGDNVIYGKALCNAKYLRSIIVEAPYTALVPSTIPQVKNLRYLSISGWNFETLPDVISNIWSLQALHLYSWSLRRLPESIGKLRRLRTLNLSGCAELTSLPDSVGDCHMISIIDLYGCKKITALPNCISKNKNLRVLRLGHTRIERLPSSITTLRNMEVLDLQECCQLVDLPEGIENLKKLVILNLEGCIKLEGMPVGIGHLTRLQTLCLFHVSQGHKLAQISELKNINRLDGELSIRNVSGAMDPYDAYKACLKDKKNLQRLTLNWERNISANFENEKAVLDALEPPSGLSVLEIGWYAGRQHGRWMLKQVDGSPRFPCLTVMILWDFPNLKHLHGLVELPCLKDLCLTDMPSLESISGGPFPSLMKITMREMPSLGEVWMVTKSRTLVEQDSSDDCPDHLGQVQIGNRLSYLSIKGCPYIKIMPYLPMPLEDVWLIGSNEQTLLLPPGQRHGTPSSPSSHPKELNLRGLMTATASPDFQSGYEWELSRELFRIFSCGGQTEMPIRSLTSRQSMEVPIRSDLCQSLNISVCSDLRLLPKCLEIPQSLRRMDDSAGSSILNSLASSMQDLRALDINQCATLHMLPNWLWNLRSLQTLKFRNLSNLTSLPQSLRHLTLLQELQIERCHGLCQLSECLGELRLLRKFEVSILPGLTYLPQSMCCLTSLKELKVIDCPGLTCLPQSISYLTSLEELLIRGCPGLTLPEWVTNLSTTRVVLQ